MDHPGTEDKREQPYRKNLISRKRLERKKEMKLGGIVPALVTPYDGEGKVNYEMLKKLGKTDVSEDEIAELEDSVQKMTDKFIKKVDEAVEVKSKEILTV